MNKLFSVLFIVCLSQQFLTAQEIKIDQSLGIYTFHHDDKELTFDELNDILKSNPKSHDMLKSAKSNYSLANVFGAAGGALIGWPIGTAIGGGDPDWKLAGIGLGFVVLSYTFMNSSANTAKEAVDIYNAELTDQSSVFNQMKINLAVSTNKFGLTISF